tara:strand:- start:22536 stop:23873 length:1338 start_codon:yes stop_codon:yes gene_type:complete
MTQQTSTVPNKIIGDDWFATEANNFKAVINANAGDAEARLVSVLALANTKMDMGNVIQVTEASQLAGTLDSNMMYITNGAIDMGTTQIEVPTTGLAIRSSGSIDSALTSSEDNYTMFVDAAGGGGNLIITGIAFTTSGTASKVFSVSTVTSTNIFSVRDSAFVACTAIGDVTDYGVIQLISNQSVFCGTGLTLDGTGITFKRDGCVSLNMVSGGTELMAGSNLLITSRAIIEDCTDVMPANTTMCDFAPEHFSRDGSFRVVNNDMTGPGAFFSAINGDDIKCRWHGNSFDPPASETNTFIGGHWVSSADEVFAATTDWAFPFEGANTTVPDHLIWFGSGISNDLTYLSTLQTEIDIRGTMSINASLNNTEVYAKIVLLDASNAFAEVDLEELPVLDLNTALRSLYMGIVSHATVNEGDILRIKLRANKNVDLTIAKNTSMSLKES